MWIEELAPEQLAEFLRHYHQMLDAFGKDGERDSWKTTANPEKNRLVAAARLILELGSSKKQQAKSRKYFAEPGKAEWGC